MRLSRRSEVDPFIVMDVMEAAARAEADGQHIIHMEVGQPGTPAPAGARQALTRAMGRGAVSSSALANCIAGRLIRSFLLVHPLLPGCLCSLIRDRSWPIRVLIAYAS